MTHQTARQRWARQKRDPYRAAQIAPSHPMPAVVCECGHARLLHEHGHGLLGGRCANEGSCLACETCVQYREVS